MPGELHSINLHTHTYMRGGRWQAAGGVSRACTVKTDYNEASANYFISAVSRLIAPFYIALAKLTLARNFLIRNANTTTIAIIIS